MGLIDASGWWVAILNLSEGPIEQLRVVCMALSSLGFLLNASGESEPALADRYGIPADAIIVPAGQAGRAGWCSKRTGLYGQHLHHAQYRIELF